jgi:phosphoglycolate phosphatase-like HAD superfamily hydrolase
MGSRTLLKHGLLLIAPFALILGTVAWVDPYGMFGWKGPVPVELKEKNLYHNGRTMPFSNLMWKLVAFERQPVRNVLLGDSRLSHFDVGHLREVDGRTWFNFGVPGGNVRTLADVFAYADSTTGLERVMVQVNFRAMNKGFDWDLFHEPSLLVNDPLLYLTNRRVIEATGLNLISRFWPEHLAYDAVPKDQWERVLKMERENAMSFTFDDKAFDLLKQIAERCHDRGIQLLFVEYPTHDEVRRIYSEAGLDDEREAYATRMGGMANYLDLDRDDVGPADRTLWRDPMHLTGDAQRLLIDRIWGNSGSNR